ncbi:hypothetical protein [Bacillus mycoides]|uniref:hypothetical protein n=1 Tax=Bacillus mycoides TaxID=1405 RepID=UPI003A80DBF5
MDVNEFERRVIGGKDVDLDLDKVSASEEAVLLNFSRRPYQSTLGLLANMVEAYGQEEGAKPLYMRIGALDLEGFNLGVLVEGYEDEDGDIISEEDGDKIVQIGTINITLEFWTKLDNNLYNFEPTLCKWVDGKVTVLNRDDFVGTIKLTVGDDDELI